MAGKLQYEQTDSKPYLPKDVAFARIASKIRANRDGCWIWVGSECSGGKCRKRAGFLRVRHNGKSVYLLSHKVAWWLEHGVYPEGDFYLRHGCGEQLCINPKHLRLSRFSDGKKMTDEQVVEARKLYWRSHVTLTKKERGSLPPSAEQFAAWALGMSLGSVQRVMRGESVKPWIWRGKAKSAEQVRAAVEAHRETAEVRRIAHEKVWTMPALAIKYKMHLSAISLMLNGETYSDVPMPEEARIRLQRQGQEAFRKMQVVRSPKILSDGSIVKKDCPAKGVSKMQVRERRPLRKGLAGALDCVMS